MCKKMERFVKSVNGNFITRSGWIQARTEAGSEEEVAREVTENLG